MGLLDQYESPDISQGLLQFGQLASQKRPFLGLLAGLAAADRSVAGRTEAQRQREMEERKMRLEEEFKRAQIAEYQAQVMQRQEAVAAAKAKAADDTRFGQTLAAAGTTSPMQALAGGGGPTIANAERIGAPRIPDWQALALQNPQRADELKKVMELVGSAQTFGMPTVARTIERDDGRGGKETVQYDAQGRPVGSGIPGYIAPVQVNQGDRATFVRPNAGVSLPINMSPSERDASARGWTTINDARAKEASGADKWQFDPTRGVQINPVTGQWRPVTAADGKPLEAKGTSAEQAAKAASTAYQTIDSMLKHPGLDTAIGLSGQLDPRNYVWGTQAQGARALIEQAQGQAFLQAFESLKGGGQITQIEGEKATAAIARLQRAQSEGDFKAAARELQNIAKAAYERAAGRPLQVQSGGGLPTSDAIAAELERRRREGATGGW